MKNKLYPVTEEITNLFIESISAYECRKKSINSIWGTKRAINYGKVYHKKEDKAWELIHKLYPELEGKNLRYLRKEKVLL
jgi:hypothetical protein